MSRKKLEQNNGDPVPTGSAAESPVQPGDRESENKAPETKKKKSLLRRIGGYLTSALTIIIVIVCVGLIFTKSNNDILYIGNHAVLYVMSGSMSPTIPSGSFIIVEKVEASEVEVGDVITFLSDDTSLQNQSSQLNTHRVMEIVGDNEEFVTKGDHNNSEDAYTAKAANIKGRYVRNAELLNTLASWFLTKWGLLITILLIIGVCCAVYLPDIVREFRKDAVKKEKAERDEAIERIKAEAMAEAQAELARQQAEAEKQAEARREAEEARAAEKKASEQRGSGQKAGSNNKNSNNKNKKKHKKH